MARTYAVATILGMERLTEAGRQIVAFVIDAGGQIHGYQTKNQLDSTEDQFYVPGHTRRLFEIKGIKFGVVICHEGWRYPETVRWAAVRGSSWYSELSTQAGGPEEGEVRMAMIRYMVVIERGETSWGAHVPDLPGCVAVGETREEVRRLIREAIEFHIDGLREEGLPVPAPTSEGEFVEVL